MRLNGVLGVISRNKGHLYAGCVVLLGGLIAFEATGYRPARPAAAEAVIMNAGLDLGERPMVPVDEICRRVASRELFRPSVPVETNGVVRTDVEKLADEVHYKGYTKRGGTFKVYIATKEGLPELFAVGDQVQRFELTGANEREIKLALEGVQVVRRLGE